MYVDIENVHHKLPKIIFFKEPITTKNLKIIYYDLAKRSHFFLNTKITRNRLKKIKNKSVLFVFSLTYRIKY